MSANLRGGLSVTIALVMLTTGCTWAKTTKQAKASSAHVAQSPALTLDVKEPLDVARRHWPISTGVPLPVGLVQDVAQLRFAGADAASPLQARVLSRWPDGSVRWALLDWQVDLAAHQERRVQVAPGTGLASAPAIKLDQQDDAIRVDTGPLRFSVPKKSFAILADVELNGEPATSGPAVSFFDIDGKRVTAQPPTSATVTESGPLRVRIELRGHYAAVFDYVVRIDAFAGQPFVRVLHTFEQHSSEPYTMVRQLGIDVPLALSGNATYSAGREKGPPFAGRLPAQGFALFQEDNEVLHAGGVRKVGRAAGWADLHDATHGVAVAGRFFWQEYPQSFRLRPTGLTYNLWATAEAPAKVGMGAAKTHELVLYFHGKTPPSAGVLGALAPPLLARVDPQWVVASGALRNSIASTPAIQAFLHEVGTAYARYQQHAASDRWDDSGLVRCPAPAVTPTPAGQHLSERPRTGYYGMFNWGDWNFPGYHDTTKGCDAWGNLEYDMTQVLALAYAATGQHAYYDGMLAAARHFMDVDRIYYQKERPNWVGMNHPKNPLHFSFELGGVDLGHTWTEGLLSYYYLSGDERGLDAARGIADYLVLRSRAVELRGNPRQWGWPQIALVAMYEATGTEAYKSAAHEYARRGIAAHAPDKIADWKVGIFADGLSYTHSVTQDPAIRDWLVRYAAAVGARGAAADARLFPAVAYVGRVEGKVPYTRAAAATVSGLKFGNWGKSFTIAGRLGFRMLSLAANAAASK